MYCRKCGNELRENDEFCGKCGVKVESVDANSLEESMSINLSILYYRKGIARTQNKRCYN